MYWYSSVGRAFDFDAKVSEIDPRRGRIKIFDFLLRIFLSYINSSALRTWFAFADDPYGWATGKLCQVIRLPMRACQWSEDDNWEWTTTIHMFIVGYLTFLNNNYKKKKRFCQNERDLTLRNKRRNKNRRRVYRKFFFDLFFFWFLRGERFARYISTKK